MSNIEFIPPASTRPSKPVPPTQPSASPKPPSMTPPLKSPSGDKSVTDYLHVEPDVVRLALKRNPWLSQYVDANGVRADKIPGWAKAIKQDLKGQPVQTVVLYDKTNPRILFLYGAGDKQGQPIKKPDGTPLALPFVPPKTPIVGKGDYVVQDVQVLPDWPDVKGGTLPPGDQKNPMGIGAIGLAYVENLRLNSGQTLPRSVASIHSWYPTQGGQNQLNGWLKQQPIQAQSNGCFRASYEDVLGAMLILGNTAKEEGPDSARLVEGYDVVIAKRPGLTKQADVMLLQADMSHYKQVQAIPRFGQGNQVTARPVERNLKTDSLARIKQRLQADLPGNVQFDDNALRRAQQTGAAMTDIGDVTLP